MNAKVERRGCKRRQSTATTHEQVTTHSSHQWGRRTARAPETYHTPCLKLAGLPGCGERWQLFSALEGIQPTPLQANQVRKGWDLCQPLKQPASTSHSSRALLGFSFTSCSWPETLVLADTRLVSCPCTACGMGAMGKAHPQRCALSRSVVLGHSTASSWVAWQASSHLVHHPAFSLSLPPPRRPHSCLGAAGLAPAPWLSGQVPRGPATPWS